MLIDVLDLIRLKQRSIPNTPKEIANTMQTNLIKGNQIADNPWQLIEKTAEFAIDTISDSDYVLLPLTVWLSAIEQVKNKNNIGVWLDSDESAEPLAEHCQSLSLIAINFPVFSDGRGYSYARSLRDYYGYEGELRAIGDVLRDQLFFYQRCGFNSYLLREDQDATKAIDGLNDFSAVYQVGSDSNVPVFRRRSN